MCLVLVGNQPHRHPAGNVYVTFPTIGTATGEINTGSWDIVLYKLDPNGNLLWNRQRPSFNTPQAETNPAIVFGENPISHQQVIYVAYRTAGTTSGQISTGNNDIAVCQFDSSGNLLWIQQQPSSDATESNNEPNITVDSQLNAYIAYWTAGGVASGQSRTGSNDIVVFKLNLTGQCQWVQQNATFNTQIDNETPSITCDPVPLSDGSQSLYVSYITDGTASGQTLTGYANIVVFRLNVTNGLTLWVAEQPSFNATMYDDYPTISVDYNGNVYVAYCTNGVASGQTKTG